jgi:hypothetical protein
VIGVLDKIAQAGMALGVGLMLQPWWQEGLRWGFFATAFFTLLHILTSHLVVRERP